MGLFEDIVSNPTWVFVFLVAGIVCLSIEILVPGFGIFGIAGLIGSGLALFSCAYYLDSWVCFGFMAVAVLAVLLELFVIDLEWYGITTIFGVIFICTGIGTYFLDRYFGLNMVVVYTIAGIVCFALIVFLFMARTVKWKDSKNEVGIYGKVIVGKNAKVIEDLNPTGKVEITHGIIGKKNEVWIATTSIGNLIKVGEEVKIVSKYGDVLKVTRK